MLVEFLADEWLTHDETLWKGIMRLAAANAMSVRKNALATTKYWTPLQHEWPLIETDQEYFDYYRELFADVVRRCSRSHRPVGYEVSGGLDSSAIFCMAETLRARGELPAAGSFAYTLDYSTYSGAGEIEYARSVGRHVNRVIQEFTPAGTEIGWYIDRAVRFRNFPGYPHGNADVALRKQAKDDGAVVLISGVGGDQFLNGTQAYYHDELLHRDWGALMKCLKADARAAGTLTALWALFRRGALPLLPESIKSKIRPVIHQLAVKRTRGGYWLSPRMKEILKIRKLQKAIDFECITNVKGQLDLLCALFYPFDSIGMDLREMYCAQTGLEVRRPYFSTSFVEFAFSTPAHLRRRGGWNKFIHTNALGGVMPESVRCRQTKADFAAPFNEIMKSAEQAIQSSLLGVGKHWLDEAGLARLRRSFVEDVEKGWQNWTLWQIFGCLTVVFGDFVNIASADIGTEGKLQNASELLHFGLPPTTRN
jgi:asparagine synthase (glutamine-hydrolysing)